MKAVIMAGGEGSRLRPLTCDLPKPMARLCGRPIIEYILDLLLRHGVTEAAVTLRYLPDRVVEHFPNSRYREVDLLFVEEEQPLGTAGSVRNACDQSDDDVLVISGDALCDFDLTAAMQRHRQSGADVTILAKRVDDPREYGLIVKDSSDRITAFVEKPAFSQAISNLANTGIYILSRRALDMIPVDRPFDFAKDLFPKMLERSMPMLCLEQKGYWCDIGDLETYVRCQLDMLEGRVDCDIHGADDGQGNIVAGTKPAGRYAIQPPVYIGESVQIEDGALIERGSILDDGVQVSSGARVSGSVLLPRSTVGRRARLTAALVGAGACVKDGAMLFEGSAVGAGAVIGDKATICAGIKVWNNKNIPASAHVAEHVKIGGSRRGFFDESGITGQVGVELTPEFCARLGAALGTVLPQCRIGIGFGPHRGGAVLADAIAAGIRSAGSGVIDFGECFQAQFEFAVNCSNARAGVFICGDNRAYVSVVDRGGLPAPRALEREIEGILSRGEFARCGWDEMGDRIQMTGIDMMYRSQLIRCAPKGLAGCMARVRSHNLAVQGLLRETLRRLGCDDGGEFQLELSAQGDKIRAYDPEFGYIPHHKILAICAAYHLERGENVAVPFDAPHVLDDVAERSGSRVLRYFTCPADDSDAEARRVARCQMWSRDGLMQALMFLHIVRSSGSLRHLMQSMPEYERAARTVEISGSPAGLLCRLSSTLPDRITEGVVLQQDGGIVLVRPLKRGTGLRILAEAHSSETATELCDFVENLVEKGKK